MSMVSTHINSLAGLIFCQWTSVGKLANKIYINFLEWLFTVTSFVVLNRLREQLLARGSTTIRGLGRTFRQLDSYDGNRKVDAGEFFVGMQENGVKITKQEADVRFYFFPSYR